MEYAVYQEASRRTRRKVANKGAGMMNALFGIMGETGEIADLVKKLYFHEHKPETIYPKLAEEAGDLLWYVAWLSDLFGFSLAELVEATGPRRSVYGQEAIIYIALRLNSNEDRLVQWIEESADGSTPLQFTERKIERGLISMLSLLWWLADEIDTTLEDIAAANIEKLHKRYPSGFDPHRSINRGQDGS